MRLPPSGPSRDQPANALAFRVGAAVLGCWAGLALGALVGLFTPHMAAWCFGTAAVGVAAGALAPEATLWAAEATLHFFIGLFRSARVQAGAGGDAERSGDEPGARWLKLALVAGAACALALAWWVRHSR